MLKTVITLVLWLLTWPAAALADPVVKILPSPLDRGTAARVMVEGLDQAANLRGEFDHRPVLFFAAGGHQIGLLGADVLLSPGRYPLRLTWEGGQTTMEVTVRDRAYGVRSIKVPPNQGDLSPADQERAARERREVEAALATQSPVRLWSGPWTPPVGGRVSSAFGRQTRINGVLNPRPHLGADLEAPAGTEVKAPADGLVILTGFHFFAGGSVYIDHGQGLISMYFHLSQIKVKAGDRVSRGDLLALSGATGRVAGPHLHYGIYLHQARLDPIPFQRLTALLPKN